MAMRIAPALFGYTGVLTLCGSIAYADRTRRGWPLTPTRCHRLLLDLRFPQRAGEAYPRSRLRSCWGRQFVYRITDVAAAEAEPILALLRCFLSRAK
jgi:hypothetical protein